MNEVPDCKTPSQAMADMTEAIMAVPKDAISISTSFGRRSDSVGGGWYWSVTWTMSVGTGRPSRPFDRSKSLAIALESSLKELTRRQSDVAS